MDGRRRARGLLVPAAALAALTLQACSGTTAPRSGAGHPPARATTTTTAAPRVPATTPPVAGGLEGVPAFSHVFVVVMENLGASGALAVPAVSALARRYESTTDWFAVSHPSLPNYLALASGSTWGVQSDCTSCTQRGPDLATQLEAAGISWGAYFEGMPGPCFLGPQSPDGSYAQKHDPFAYFADVRSSPAVCAHLQPLTALTSLLPGPARSVPRFVWVSPDLCHSGHDCAPETAGQWLRAFVGQVTASEAWRDGGLLVVTWDEGEDDAGLDPAGGSATSGGGGRVLTLVVAPGTVAGRVVGGPFGHYSLLRTVEDGLGLAHLGNAGARGVVPMRAFFAGSS